MPGAGAFFNGATSPTPYGDFVQDPALINSYSQGGAGGAYVVQAGDTLARIAAQLWGDASLWHRIAEANGLSANTALAEGQTLTIPAGVLRSTHNANTFKAYDPAAALGDTTPTAPAPPSRGNKCGGFGAVLMVVIAIVVTIYLQPLAEKAWFAAFKAMGVAKSALVTASTVAGAVTTGAVASIASQGAGVVTGAIDKFSWNAVALSALSAGVVSAGVGDRIAQIFNATKGTAAYLAISAGANSAVSQGFAMAVGLQSKFDWAGVAGAVAGAAVGRDAGNAMGKTAASHPLIARAGVSMASNIANAAARSLIDGTNFGDNMLAALPDLIGQMIAMGIMLHHPNSADAEEGGAHSDLPNAPSISEAEAAALGNAADRSGFDDLTGLGRYDTNQFVDTKPVIAGQDDVGGVSFVLDEGRSGDGITSEWILASGAGGAIRIISHGDSRWRYDGGTIRIDELGLTLIQDMPANEAFEVVGVRTDAHRAADLRRQQAEFAALGRQIEAQTFRDAPRAAWGAVQGVAIGGGRIVVNTVQAAGGLLQWGAGMSPIGLLSDAVFIGDTPEFLPSLRRSLAQGQATADAVAGVIGNPTGALDSIGASIDASVEDFQQRLGARDIEGAFRELGADVTENFAPFGAPGVLSRAGRLTAFARGGAVESVLATSGDDLTRLAARGGCFAAGTLIHAREGLKPIEDIAAGDFVLAQPEFQGERGYRRVNEVFCREPQDLVSVEIIEGVRRETITATLEHPFWVVGEGWVGAQDLRDRASLELADGRIARVGTVTRLTKQQPVFNFAVDGFRTYYVGELGVWVHNTSKVGSLNYRRTFFAANPSLRGKVVVHHAVERQVMKRYPGLFTPQEINALENLRGVPKRTNPRLHLSVIRKEWNRFYREFRATGAQPTRQQLLLRAAEIDAKYGSRFRPPVR